MINGSTKKLRTVVDRWDESNVSIEKFVVILTEKINTYHKIIDPIGEISAGNSTVPHKSWRSENSLAWVKHGTTYYLALIKNTETKELGKKDKSSYYLLEFITEDYEQIALKKYGKRPEFIADFMFLNERKFNKIPTDVVKDR